MAETWAPVAGFAGLYEVSNLGRVRSWNAPGRGQRIRSQPKTLRPTRGTCGYFQVSLKRSGTEKKASVHRLVAEAFLRRRPGREEVNHRNGDKLDNAAANLEWVSRQENVDHAVALGLACNGERHGRSALSALDVRIMRAKASYGVPTSRIAEDHGVHPDHARSIVVRRYWSHLA